MTSETISFAEPYAGVFLTENFPDLARKRELFHWGTLAQWVYQYPRGAICVVLGGRHAESVTRWLDAGRNALSGKSMLVGVLANGRRFPKESDSYLFRVPVRLLSDSRRCSAIVNPSHFCLFLPHSAEILVLTSAQDGLHLLETVPDVFSPLTGLVLQESAELAKTQAPSKGPYDPIASQIREVLGPLAEAVLQRVDDFLNEWRSVFHEDPPSDLLQWRAEISQHIETTRADMRQYLATKKEQREIFLRSFSILTLMLHAESRFARQRRRQLSDYRISEQPVVGHGTTYRELSGAAMLRAARRYVEDVAVRLGVDQSYRFLPVLGTNFRIAPAADPGLWTPPARSRRTMVVEMPSVYNLRLGALPVLANPVAHLLGDEHPELVRALCESRDPTLREVVALVTGTEPRTNATRRLIEERVGLWRRASEVLADLVATAAVGPSYVYAAARFTIGTLSEFTGQPTSSTVSPPFPGRVRLCLAFLRAMGHQAPFSSEYLEVPNSALDSNLCAAIARLVKEPFAGDEQLEVSHDSLRAGRIASSRPVEIVGALWRAVVRKSGYLNEMAALLSVIGNG